MNRNIFKQRLLLECWLVVDRMPLREATDILSMAAQNFERLERPLKESLIFFKSRVSEPVSPGNYGTRIRTRRLTQGEIPLGWRGCAEAQSRRDLASRPDRVPQACNALI